MTGQNFGPRRTGRAARLRLKPLRLVDLPARRQLLTEVRAIVSSSGFYSLDDLGAAAGGLTKQRASELLAGHGLANWHTFRSVLQACRASGGLVDKVARLYAAAVAERTAAEERACHPLLGLWARVDMTGALPEVDAFDSWIDIGVHPPIMIAADGSLLAATNHALPAYVLRDKDISDFRPALRAACDASSSQLIVVAGPSAAGKTRAAAEGIRDELRGWRLLVPYGLAAVSKILFERINLRHTVVWLDDVQNFLNHWDAHEQLEQLLGLAGGPTVLLATIRSDAEAALRDTPSGRLLYRRGIWVRLDRRCSASELQRARDLTGDKCVAEALNRIGDRYGLPEYIAAGPQMVHRWECARGAEPVAAAVIDAAVDCYRAGYTRPVPEALLYEAHTLYLEPHTRSSIDSTRESFANALAWARRPVFGASALLTTVRARGDQAFDYLLGHAEQPTFRPVHPGIWPLLLQHTIPWTIPTIALAAKRFRQSQVVTECLARTPTDDLPHLYFQLGDVDGLTALAETDHCMAEVWLAFLLFERGDVPGLTAVAASGNNTATDSLIKLLFERKDEEGLAALADKVPVRPPDADFFLWCRDRMAAVRLMELKYQRGDMEGLTVRADAGDEVAAVALAALLLQRGDEAGLTARANLGDKSAAARLADLLLQRGDEAKLTARADAGERKAAQRLAELLVQRGDEAKLSARAEAGDRIARWVLGTLRTEPESDDELADTADAGDRLSAMHLASLLIERGDERELTRRADAGDEEAQMQLARLLSEHGDEVTLHARAHRGDESAARRLSQLLYERGDETALREGLASGINFFGFMLMRLLSDRGNESELAAFAEASLTHAGTQLNWLLFDRGDEAGLALQAGKGDEDAVRLLVRLRLARGKRSDQ